MCEPIEQPKLNPRQEVNICPMCSSDDCDKIHHQATFGFPECWYWLCNECGHEFDIQ